MGKTSYLGFVLFMVSVFNGQIYYLFYILYDYIVHWGGDNDAAVAILLL